MKGKKLPPIHPGEILMEEFLKPMGISQYRLAKDISVPPRRINEIVHGKRAITAISRSQKIRLQIVLTKRCTVLNLMPPNHIYSYNHGINTD